MRVIVIGGKGMAGGHAALGLATAGHDATIAVRRSAEAGTRFGRFAWRRFDHLDVRASTQPDGSDALVFAAGQDRFDID